MRQFSNGARIDLHTHTTVSDGVLPPRELVRAAKKSGISILAITDHDATDALDEAIAEGTSSGLKIIPAIEISTRGEGNLEIHILGYGIDYRRKSFQDALDNLRRSRIDRVYKTCNELKKLGVDISAEEVLSTVKGRSATRAHIARLVVEKGYADNIREAFSKYLGHNAPAYVKAADFTPRDAIELIKSVGGITSLAHPGLLGDDTVIPPLVGDSLQALEVFHRYDNRDTYKTYLAMARKYKLLITGGSDFHGRNSDCTAAGLGEIVLPYEHFIEVEKAMVGK